MKSIFLLVSAVCALGAQSGDAAALTVRWRAVSARLFSESTTQAGVRQVTLNRKEATRLGLDRCANERERQWNEFRKLKKVGPFRHYSKPTAGCAALALETAPVLQIAFRGQQGVRYVLETIVVEVSRFRRLQAGGFVDRLAKYDVGLPLATGLKEHSPFTQLRFDGEGELNVRLWPEPSDDEPLPESFEVDLELRFVFNTPTGEHTAGTGQFRVVF